MKRFKFSLQTLHDLRQRERERAEMQLVEIAAALRVAEVDWQAVVNLRAESATRYIAALSTDEAHTDTAYHLQMQWQADYINSLIHREQAAHRNLRALEAKRDAQRQAVMIAAQAAETMVNLRAQHQARHYAEAARQEQLALDESATLAHTRRQREYAELEKAETHLHRA